MLLHVLEPPEAVALSQMESLSIPAAAWFSGGAIHPPHARLSQPYLFRKPTNRNPPRLNAASRSGDIIFLSLSLSACYFYFWISSDSSSSNGFVHFLPIPLLWWFFSE